MSVEACNIHFKADIKKERDSGQVIPLACPDQRIPIVRRIGLQEYVTMILEPLVIPKVLESVDVAPFGCLYESALESCR